MGARFRLDGRLPLAGYRADTRAVLRAMKRYGLVLAGRQRVTVVLPGRVARRLAALLEELTSVPARAFVAVRTLGLMVDPDSGEAG